MFMVVGSNLLQLLSHIFSYVLIARILIRNSKNRTAESILDFNKRIGFDYFLAKLICNVTVGYTIRFCGNSDG